MCNTVVKDKYESGFSLLELAIVLVLAGLILAPAVSLYHNYRIEKDWTETESNVDLVVNELGGYRSVYGRYPCPTSRTSAPGDLDYGHESCTVNPIGSCANGTCTYASNIPGKIVLVGTIPFKTLNLQESESFDSNLNRFSYAVTLELTSSATFSLTGGGVGINDKTGVSIIDPPDTAHFVIISHGSNKIGGFTRAGVESGGCLSGSPLEQENCDGNATFRSGEIDDNFDDRIGFFSSVALSEWQTSALASDEIHLKNANSIAVGVQPTTDLSAAEQTTVRDVAPGTGSIMATSDFHTDSLCEYGAAGAVDCFAPRLFAGSLNFDGTRFEDETTGGSGMSCYKPSLAQDNFLVGVENGQPICRDEIFVSCPDGSFVTGIDGTGKVVCNSAPAPRCPDLNITTTCGDNRTLLETFSGGDRSVYSGECRKITNYNSAYFASALAGLDPGQISALVNTLNNETRTIADCGPSVSNSQVRDSYSCDAGTWNFIRAHEKIYPWYNYPSNKNAGGSWPAETGGGGADPQNNRYDHDCWCREDYRVITDPYCPSGQTGTRVRIQKHRCPQTGHYWNTVHTNYQNCGCVPGTTTSSQSCNSYYDEVNGTSGTTGLSGTVTKTFDITCSGSTPITATTPSSVDSSACYCPSNSQYVQRGYCATGTTNSWSWTGGTETGVETLSTSDWVCPGTTTGGLPDPGTWGTLTPYTPIPACTCDAALTDIVIETCPSGLQGAGLKYEREWDCTTGTWETRPDWTLLENNCNSCSWKAPTGAPSLEDFAYGKKTGSTCACGSTPEPLCYDYGSGGKYKVWTGCQCVIQLD